jgi:diguanylate cyclase
MMIDADDFQFLNAEYGHLAGDKVLYFIAQSIKTMIRSGDKVYRYGGEEFAVILGRCDEKQAFAIADNIRSKIAQSNLMYMGKTIRVTVSVGVTVHKQGDTYDDILGRADKALYCAKKSNTNCTISFDW